LFRSTAGTISDVVVDNVNGVKEPLASYRETALPTSASSHARCVYANDASVAAAVVRNKSRFVDADKGSSSSESESESGESRFVAGSPTLGLFFSSALVSGFGPVSNSRFSLSFFRVFFASLCSSFPLFSRHRSRRCFLRFVFEALSLFETGAGGGVCHSPPFGARGRYVGAGISCKRRAGHRLRVAFVRASKSEPAEGIVSKRFVAKAPVPASLNIVENVAHAHEHLDAMARVMAFAIW